MMARTSRANARTKVVVMIARPSHGCFIASMAYMATAKPAAVMKPTALKRRFSDFGWLAGFGVTSRPSYGPSERSPAEINSFLHGLEAKGQEQSLGAR